jgi:aminoglycoside phosphotransferase (APT) family kinase protein
VAEERLGGGYSNDNIRRWSISAVLDWEFAFSGSPPVDVGNMLRFREEQPDGFAAGFIAGYREAGGLGAALNVTPRGRLEGRELRIPARRTARITVGNGCRPVLPGRAS